ncbi:hypothetical protein ACH3VR_16620 [Microbacterium sp. B2969]|uniref:Uncharacterized protein n=1 Tax=Microbacterium alkaliflavum TaxID=3248839 RepID=A0ABW7QAS8_9MICO
MSTFTHGTRFAAAAVSAGLIILACAACTADATALDRSGGQKTPAPTTLTIGMAGWEIHEYANTVAAMSHGRVELDALSWEETSNKVGWRTPALLDAVRKGTIPLAAVPAASLGEFGVSSLDPLIAPFVVDSLAMEEKLLQDDELTAAMLQDVSQLGVEPVGIIPGSLAHPFGTSGTLLTAADFEGATISTSRGQVTERAFALLGTKFIEWESNGARFDNIKGSLLPVMAIPDNNFHKAGRSVTGDVTFWPRPVVVIGNPAALAALDEQERAALHDAVKAVIPTIVEGHALDDSVGTTWSCGVGMTFPRAGAAAIAGLRAKVRPLIDEIAATEVGAQVFQRVAELRATTPPEKPLECMDPPADWPTEVSDRLDGTYTADVTRDDRLAQGYPDWNIADEDWGHYMLVVKDGRFAMTQQNASSCTWKYGEWRMNDDLVRETIGDGGGNSPNWVADRPGMEWIFNWTDFQGKLLLAGATEVAPFATTFTRVSRVPDLDAFPGECVPPVEAFGR